jgi:hypothetical protein
MRKDALGRKRRWSRKNGGPVHTVVVDWRDQSHKDPKTYSGHRIYFHAGVGSFRLDSMVPVKNARHLRDLIEEATP